MNKIYSNKWIVLFIIVLAMHLTAIVLKQENLIALSKPLLLLALFMYYLFTTTNKNIIIIAAIILSWLGDVLLLFQHRNELFFTLGLASFLIAQLCYAIYFTKQLKDRKTFSKIILFAVGAYAIGFYFLLLPKLGAMQIPVLIYALSISCMLIAALQFATDYRKYVVCAIGALFFVASDSKLAINKFHTSFETASFLIMITYGLAQLLLVVGVVQYENNKLP
jgi:uncharacterized membrane protein YhhN